jgi:hypothetical protein
MRQAWHSSLSARDSDLHIFTDFLGSPDHISATPEDVPYCGLAMLLNIATGSC